MLLNLAFMFASFLLLLLFLMKKRQVPFWMPIYYLLGVTLAVFEYLSLRYLFSELPEIADAKLVRESMSALIRSGTAVALWGSYFQKSVRVRNTFDR